MSENETPEGKPDCTICLGSGYILFNNRCDCNPAPEEPEKGPPVVERMSDDNLKQFVKDYCAGKLFLSCQVPNDQQRDMLPMIFMPIALGALSEFSEEEAQNIGVIYEYVDKAGPRSINGYPVFFSFSYMHIEDWQRCIPAIKKQLKLMEEVDL